MNTNTKAHSILMDILNERKRMSKQVESWKELIAEYKERKQAMENGDNANEEQPETEI